MRTDSTSNAVADLHRNLRAVQSCLEDLFSAKSLVEHYRISDTGISIQYGTTALKRAISPVIAPLRHPNPECTLEIRVTECPNGRWLEPIQSIMSIHQHPPAPCSTLYSHTTDHHILLWQEHGIISELTLIDRQRRLALVFLKHDNLNLSHLTLHSPLRNLLAAWFQEDGSVMIHGAAIGRESGGVLLCGPNGSGKSTSVLACADMGIHSAGDDSVLVKTGNIPQAYLLYGTASARTRDLRKYPSLAHLPQAARLESTKVDIFLENHVLRVPLQAICIVNQHNLRESCCTTVSRAAVLRVLMTGSLNRNPVRTQLALTRMKDLVTCLPCFSLTIGTCPQQLSKTIGTFLCLKPVMESENSYA